MHKLAKYITTPYTKGNDYNQAYWSINDKGLSEYEICVETKD